MRLFFWSLFIIALAGCADNSPSLIATPQTFTGQLQQHPWQKSTDSYCAGGSEYFTLQRSNGQQLVLSTPQNIASWQALVGRQVSIKGIVKTKVIAPPNEMSQQPVSLQQMPSNTTSADGSLSTFSCQVLEVKEIEPLQ